MISHSVRYDNLQKSHHSMYHAYSLSITTFMLLENLISLNHCVARHPKDACYPISGLTHFFPAQLTLTALTHSSEIEPLD